MLEISSQELKTITSFRIWSLENVLLGENLSDNFFFFLDLSQL